MWWLIGILVIGALIFVHELGHFLVAKWCRVGVLKFAIGFGPALVRFRTKETTYQLGLIPLGGFVRMVGDIPDMITGAQATDDEVRNDATAEQASPEDLHHEDLTPEMQAMISDRSRWFVEKGFWARSAIVFAGPLFNFIFALVLITFSAWTYGQQSARPEAIIGEVQEDRPAALAGLQVGDRITSVNGTSVETWIELQTQIHQSAGSELSLQVERGGNFFDATVKPQMAKITGLGRKVFLIGIKPSVEHKDVSLISAMKISGMWTLGITAGVYESIWQMITGKASPSELAGPLFILETAKERAEKGGLEQILVLTAFLSVSLAVLNLLPIPILDGGHLLFFIIEALLGPISMRKKEFAQGVGMLLLLMLMVFAIHNDIFADRSMLKNEVVWEDSDDTKATKESK